MIKLGILGSTRGSHLPVLDQAIHAGKLMASINVIVSNKQEAQILSRAHALGIPAVFVDPTGLSRETYDSKVSDIMRHYQVDLIVLMGYMRILSNGFIEAWRNKIINVHPSLLPAFAGLMDMQVHEAVIKAGVPETGCTVHHVSEVVDAGPVILQKKCPVLSTDTPDKLKERVQVLEAEAIVEAIAMFA